MRLTLHAQQEAAFSSLLSPVLLAGLGSMRAPSHVTAELWILLLFCYVNDVTNSSIDLREVLFVSLTLVYLHQGALDGGRLDTDLKMRNQSNQFNSILWT